MPAPIEPGKDGPLLGAGRTPTGTAVRLLRPVPLEESP
jgi:hypothetical protein